MKKLLILTFIFLIIFVSGCQNYIVGQRNFENFEGNEIYLPNQKIDTDIGKENALIGKENVFSWVDPFVKKLRINESMLSVNLVSINEYVKNSCIINYLGQNYQIKKEDLKFMEEDKIIGISNIAVNETAEYCELFFADNNSIHKTYNRNDNESDYLNIYKNIITIKECSEVYNYSPYESRHLIGEYHVKELKHKSYHDVSQYPIIATLNGGEDKIGGYCNIIVIEGERDYPQVWMITDTEIISEEDNVVKFTLTKEKLPPYDPENYTYIVKFGDGHQERFEFPKEEIKLEISHNYSLEDLEDVNILIPYVKIVNDKEETVRYVDTGAILVFKGISNYYPNMDIITEERYLKLNNQRFFPIGLFNVDMRLPISQKFNLAWFNDVGYHSRDYGSSVKSFISSYIGYTFSDFEISERKIIETLIFSNKSNFIGWINKDEPIWSGSNIEKIEENYNKIKQYDPYRPIWMNFAPAHRSDDLQEYINDVREYSQYADIISVDVYPVGATCQEDNQYCIIDTVGLNSIGAFVDLYLNEILYDSPNKPFWMILQGNSIDPNFNYQQIRFMSYQAIIHGATGVFYYQIEDDLQIMIAIELVTRQLSDLKNILTINPTQRQINTNDGIEYIELNDYQYIYIIAINTNEETTQKIFSTTYNGNIEVLYEDRNIVTENGEFLDAFEPYDVNIYRYSKNLRFE